MMNYVTYIYRNYKFMFSMLSNLFRLPVYIDHISHYSLASSFELGI